MAFLVSVLIAHGEQVAACVSRPHAGRKAGVLHTYRLHAWHTETVWRGADCLAYGIKGEVFEKVASHGAGFEAFCLVHGVLVFNVSGCALALLCSPPLRGASRRNSLSVESNQQSFCGLSR